MSGSFNAIICRTHTHAHNGLRRAASSRIVRFEWGSRSVADPLALLFQTSAASLAAAAEVCDCDIGIDVSTMARTHACSLAWISGNSEIWFLALGEFDSIFGMLVKMGIGVFLDARALRVLTVCQKVLFTHSYF